MLTEFPTFALLDYHIPADPRDISRQYFFDRFLGTANRSELTAALRRKGESPVSRPLKGKVKKYEPCLVVPLHESMGKYAGFYMRGEEGGEWIIHRRKRRKLKGFVLRKPSYAFRNVYGFESLIKDGSALSVAANPYTIIYHPQETR
jgi:hypothetical protein